MPLCAVDQTWPIPTAGGPRYTRAAKNTAKCIAPGLFELMGPAASTGALTLSGSGMIGPMMAVAGATTACIPFVAIKGADTTDVS